MRWQPGVTRRTLLCNTALGTAALAAGGIGAYAQPASKPPNIIFILADDLGYADVSCYGRRDFTTPNIDRIAARGMRFLQGYANSAVCSATRLALITGRYQYRLRLGLEEPLSGNPEVGLPPEHPTLPSLLKRAGYGTSLIGKWHLGALPKFGPLKSGYDHFFGFRAAAVDYFSHINPLQRHDLWDQDVEVDQVGYLTDQLGARAVDAVSSYAKSGQPFLISLHFNAPHWPWEGPGDEAESKRLAGTALRDFDGGTRKTYQRMIEAMDAQIGRVLEALDAHGLTENTIVIFTSDNGGERFSDTWPFTGKKTDLLEGGLRIPMVIAWPRTSRRAASATRWPSAWTGFRPCWLPPAPRRTRAIRPTA
jgi:arylsulfatase A-like enzyme